MNRRHFLTASASMLAAASLPSFAAGAGAVPYSRETYQRLLADGEPFLLDFYASW